MLLIESIIGKPILEETKREKLPEGVLSRVTYLISNIDERNANNRVYEKAVWEKVLGDDSIREKLENRCLFGQAEHPAETQSDLQLTSHVIHKMWIDEEKNEVYQTLDIIDTPTGRIVDALLRAECMVGVSTRAEGDIEEAESDEGPYHRIVPESYNYYATDFTADPSTFGTVPIDVKRNVVSSVAREATNKEAKEPERKFAQLLLESMECDDKSKCQHCGCCKKIKEAKEIKEGTWAIPYVEKDAQKIATLMEGPLDPAEAKKQFYGLLGDDTLFDAFDEAIDNKVTDVRPEVSHFLEGKIDWLSDKIEPGATEILRKLLPEKRTMEDLVKAELVKAGAIVEFKDGEHKGKKGKVEKIEEFRVGIVIGDTELTHVNLEGDLLATVTTDGVITVSPLEIPPEVEPMAEPAFEEPEPEIPEEEQEVVEPSEEEEEEVEEKCRDKKKVKEQEVSVSDKHARPNAGIPTGIIPVEKGLNDKILPGNVLRDKEEKYWVVKDLNVTGLSIETAGGGVGAEINVPWEEVESRGLIKVQEVKVNEAEEGVTKKDIVDWLKGFLYDIKRGDKTELKGQSVEIVSVDTFDDPHAQFRPQTLYYITGQLGDNWFAIMYGTDEGLSEGQYEFEFASSSDELPTEDDFLRLGESKVDETKDIKAMYKSAGLPSPDGKGIHTKAFHELAIDVAKGYVKAGDSPEEALKKAYPTAMKQLGKEKAVKEPHRSESKLQEGLESHANMILGTAGFTYGEDYGWDRSSLVVYEENDVEKIMKALDDSGEFGPTSYDEKTNEISFGEYKSESKEVKEQEGNYVPKVGDTIQIMDLEGNTVVVPKATVAQADEALGSDGNMYTTVEVTGSDDEDEQQWYSEEQYQIILLTPAKESISTTAKEMIDLRIQEASTRAERDKSFEVIAELEGIEEFGKDKLLEVKILIRKLKETMSRDGQIINALRKKVEEKAVLAKQVEKQLSEMKANLEKDMAELKESMAAVEKKHEEEKEQLEAKWNKEIGDLNESIASTEKEHSEEIEQLKTESNKKISEEVEKARKEVTKDITKEFVKQFVMFRLAETGLTVDENSRALLEECRSLDQVDDTLDELRDIGRRSALHSQPLKEVVIAKSVDPDQADVDRKVGAVFEGFGYKKGINDD